MLRILSIRTRIFFVMLALFTTLIAIIAFGSHLRALAAGPLENSFQQASQEFNVPEDLLKAICQQAWHTSTTEGQYGTSETYGCGLVKQTTTLDKTANEMYGGILGQDIRQNIQAPSIVSWTRLSTIVTLYPVRTLPVTTSLPPTIPQHIARMMARSLMS